MRNAGTKGPQDEMKNKMKVGLVVGVMALTGCQLNSSEQTRDELGKYEGKTPECFMILPDADTQRARGLEAEQVFGDLDYTDGIWVVVDGGWVLGYSQYEDAIIWPTAECAATMPEYMGD